MLNLEDINFLKNNVFRIRDNINIPPTQIEELLFPKGDFKLIGVYGRGAEAIVFKILSVNNGKHYALKLKFSNEESRALSEFYIQQEFAKFNMAPNIYEFSFERIKFKNYNLSIARAIMDPIHSTLYNYTVVDKKGYKKIMPALECLIKKKYLLMHPYPFLHCDMSFNNIVILNDGRTLGFIDFAYSARMPDILQFLDCIPLIGSLLVEDTNNCTQLAQHVMKFYEQMFNVKLEFSRFRSLLNGGFGYMINDWDFLHSYIWDSKDHYGVEVVSPEKLMAIFPQILPPKVV